MTTIDRLHTPTRMTQVVAADQAALLNAVEAKYEDLGNRFTYASECVATTADAGPDYAGHCIAVVNPEGEFVGYL